MIDPSLEADLVNDTGPEGTLAAILISYLDSGATDYLTRYHTGSITILNDGGYEEIRVDILDTFGDRYELTVKRVREPQHMQD